MVEKATSMRSLERAIDVLETLDGAVGPLRLTEIARLAGLPVATTQRILATLEARDRVERDGFGYRPGIGLAFGAHAYSASNPLIRVARPVLMQVALSTGLTATLFREHRGRRVVLARADNAKNLLGELVVGSRLPLHVGAGKALLAAHTDDEVDQLLAAVLGDETDGDDAAQQREALLKDLTDIRRCGYSISLGERDPAIGSVAAAFSAPEGVMAAVQLAGPIDQLMDEDVQRELGRQVQRAAFWISEATAGS